MLWRVWVRANERDVWRFHREFSDRKLAYAAVEAAQLRGQQAKADYIGRSVAPNAIRKTDY